MQHLLNLRVKIMWGCVGGKIFPSTCLEVRWLFRVHRPMLIWIKVLGPPKPFTLLTSDFLGLLLPIFYNKTSKYIVFLALSFTDWHQNTSFSQIRPWMLLGSNLMIQLWRLRAKYSMKGSLKGGGLHSLPRIRFTSSGSLKMPLHYFALLKIGTY